MNLQNAGPVNPDAAAQRAQLLLQSEINARVDAVRELAKRLNAVDAALADYESAWQFATRTGWSEGTLRDIGLRAPGSSPERSPRRAAEPAATTGPTGLAPVVAIAPVHPTVPAVASTPSNAPVSGVFGTTS